MIISEKQILQLMQIAHNYLDQLKLQSFKNILTEEGQLYKMDLMLLLVAICNQQSEELKEIK